MRMRVKALVFAAPLGALLLTSAASAEYQPGQNVPNWRELGLHCNPKTWISSSAWAKKCHGQPGRFAWVCPSCDVRQ